MKYQATLTTAMLLALVHLSVGEKPRKPAIAQTSICLSEACRIANDVDGTDMPDNAFKTYYAPAGDTQSDNNFEIWYINEDRTRLKNFWGHFPELEFDPQNQGTISTAPLGLAFASGPSGVLMDQGSAFVAVKLSNCEMLYAWRRYQNGNPIWGHAVYRQATLSSAPYVVANGRDVYCFYRGNNGNVWYTKFDYSDPNQRPSAPTDDVMAPGTEDSVGRPGAYVHQGDVKVTFVKGNGAKTVFSGSISGPKFMEQDIGVTLNPAFISFPRFAGSLDMVTVDSNGKINDYYRNLALPTVSWNHWVKNRQIDVSGDTVNALGFHVEGNLFGEEFVLHRSSAGDIHLTSLP